VIDPQGHGAMLVQPRANRGAALEHLPQPEINIAMSRRQPARVTKHTSTPPACFLVLVTWVLSWCVCIHPWLARGLWAVTSGYPRKGATPVSRSLACLLPGTSRATGTRCYIKTAPSTGPVGLLHKQANYSTNAQGSKPLSVETTFNTC